MTTFDRTETQFEHFYGKLVKYDNKTLAIGGLNDATVEELNSMESSWKLAEHPMSPVNGYNRLNGFSALSIEKSLYIFGESRLKKNMRKIYIIGGIPTTQKVLKWNGNVWNTLENEMCTKQDYRTTFVYRGAIYHAGGWDTESNDQDISLYNR